MDQDTLLCASRRSQLSAYITGSNWAIERDADAEVVEQMHPAIALDTDPGYFTTAVPKVGGGIRRDPLVRIEAQVSFDPAIQDSLNSAVPLPKSTGTS